MRASRNPPSVLGRIRLCSLPEPRASYSSALFDLAHIGRQFHSLLGTSAL